MKQKSGGRTNQVLFAVLVALVVVAYWSLQPRRPSPQQAEVPAPPSTLPVAFQPKPPVVTTTGRSPSSVNRYAQVSWPRKTTLYLDSRVVSEWETAPDPEGYFERNRIVETRKKYPLIRIREKLQQQGGNQIQYKGHQTMIADHIMIMVKPGKTKDDVERLANQFGGRIRRTVNAKTYLVSFDSSKPDSLDEAVNHFLAQKDVIQVSEPDYVYGLGE